MPNVFLSSDPFSIASGEPWLEAVLRNLNSCTDFVALITDREDWKNTWITFETGYFMGRIEHSERQDGIVKRPQVFVFDNLMTSVSWPLSGLHLIDTNDSFRVQRALLDMHIGPWDGKCIEEFTNLFKTPCKS